ncbi:Acetate kinase [Rubripirellula amarantea]|uniref:Acetate kinase n=1 Tax=Rubripirellula amarantea TaxID=2527999 RepID=A0A5C5WV10_9BACT|nr:acetate/propionate family kinase [Rubripirellula amarantea]TWT54804.1 Acetate kinase [Rubripirellula amarantea]
MNREHILTINAGSSSIKFAVYQIAASQFAASQFAEYQGDDSMRVGISGTLDRIGKDETRLTFRSQDHARSHTVECQASDHADAIDFLMDWFESEKVSADVAAVGHRIVHATPLAHPEVVTPELLDELYRDCSFAPQHLVNELAIVQACRRRMPDVPQVLCFDSSFHHTMPRVASTLAIPRRYQSKGIKRYGYHGLSYTYLMQELRRLGDPAASEGRVILAHLGNGASMAAVLDGKCIDTSMGFTPAAGLPMGSRSGDLDPGLFSYMVQREGLKPEEFFRMANHESGLLGISETSSDMRDLLAIESTDVRAAEAIDVFCYQAKKLIGAYAAALGGLDTLVFSGGIGERSPEVRARICASLKFLGIALNDQCNSKNECLISDTPSSVNVRVIPTDEQIVIANSVADVVKRLHSQSDARTASLFPTPSQRQGTES